MRFISPGAHRALDFVAVAAFALAPTLLRLSGFAAILAYALAAVHVMLTLLTAFHRETREAVPLPAHGWIELAVGMALVTLPWITAWQGTPRTFYLAAGTVILVVWLLSRYDYGAPGVGT